MRKPETYRNEIKSYIVRTGMTMTEVVDYLSDEYGWSRSVPNLSGKLKRGLLRYGEADFPLFPSSPARSNPILGQNWVRI